MFFFLIPSEPMHYPGILYSICQHVKLLLNFFKKNTTALGKEMTYELARHIFVLIWVEEKPNIHNHYLLLADADIMKSNK